MKKARSASTKSLRAPIRAAAASDPADSVLRLAVVSDLHAFSPSDPNRPKDAPAPSLLNSNAPDVGLSTHIIAKLLELITKQPIRADYLLCPGDLGDRGSSVGIRYAWDQCKRIRDALGAKCVIATAGNHDFARGVPDGMGALKDLSDFPVTDAALRTQYWAWDYLIIDQGPLRLIALNTVAEHALQAEADHGLIKPRTIAQIARELESMPRAPLQVLLCHHPPHWHGDHKLGDTDLLQNGQLLLDMLSTHGNWIVIHGHKHHAKIVRAMGSAAAPWVFAAGSLAAMLTFEGLVGIASNQFFVLEFDRAHLDSGAWGGTGRAWNWAHEVGWRDNDQEWATFGFGFSGPIPALAQQIAQTIRSQRQPWMTWQDLSKALPDLQYLTPANIDLLRHELRIEPTSGRPVQVGGPAI